MAFVNYNNKEITVKIVYYGPALSGKTTCLKYIYESGEYKKKGKLITLDTDGDRTLFFDFLPIEIGKLGDYSIKMQLYTVPGQVAYNTTRKLVLQGSDGIAFVADSQVVMRDQNLDSLNNLRENLKANNIAFEETPLIFQYNKRDLREILPLEILNKDLNPENKAFFPTVGTSGENILEALHTIMKMVIIHLKNKLSIFQKDKTVMFSRDEVTDHTIKKSQTPTPTPRTIDRKPEPMITPRPAPPPPLVTPKTQPKAGGVRDADTEKEEIFELSSSLSMSEEPLKTRDYPKIEDDIFNLGDDNRYVSDGIKIDLDLPESADMFPSPPVKSKENTDFKAKNPSRIIPPEPIIEIEDTGREYDVKQDDIAFETPSRGEKIMENAAPKIRTGIDVPIFIEIPEDKDEIKINLNLQIVIKKK